jgi:hypothetical protein
MPGMRQDEFDDMMKDWLVRQRGRLMVPVAIAGLIWIYWYFDLYR